MGIFKMFSKKEKREFDELDFERKKEIIAKEISDKLKVERDKMVSQAFVDGFLFAHNMMFEKHIMHKKDIDWQMLREEIEENAKRYRKKFEKKDGEQAGNEVKE